MYVYVYVYYVYVCMCVCAYVCICIYICTARALTFGASRCLARVMRATRGVAKEYMGAKGIHGRMHTYIHTYRDSRDCACLGVCVCVCVCVYRRSETEAVGAHSLYAHTYGR